MRKTPYTVYEKYDFSALCHYISSITRTDFKIVHTKRQLKYLDKYLIHPQVSLKTVFIEHEYIEKSYLSDYAEYFVRCFDNYGRKATRIHFFSHQFSEVEFSDFLSGKITGTEAKSFLSFIKSSYIGFLVIRPIPETFIAKLCIAPYKYITSDNPVKNIITKKTQVSLFGIDLEVDALPFQEQDQVISACATASIWSFLNAPIFKFNEIPSPVAITKIAFSFSEGSKLNAGTAGLSLNLMSDIFNKLNLSTISTGEKSLSFTDIPLKKSIIERAKRFLPSSNKPINKPSRELQKLRYLKEYVYAYGTAKFPVILGLEVYENQKDGYRFLGWHVVTVVGYSINKTKAKLSGDDVSLFADDIDYIYIHDDKTGPYARAELSSGQFKLKGGPDLANDHPRTVNEVVEINLNQADTKNNDHRVYLPDLITLGVYPKIRIPYSTIKLTCASYNGRLFDIEREILKPKNLTLNYFFGMSPKGHKWSIRLFTVGDYKRHILSLPPNKFIGDRTKFLASSMPKYLWIATAFDSKDEKLFDFLFDATDIKQGSIYLDTNYFNETYKFFIDKVFASFVRAAFTERVDQNYLYNMNDALTPICKRIIEDQKSYSDYLDECFGPPRPPSYYKEGELENDGQVSQSDVYTFINIPPHSEDRFKLSKDTKYIWAISEEGYLYIGDDKAGGHPTLNPGLWARSAGELLFKDGEWLINGFSGRFMRSKYWHQNEHIENASKLIQKYTDINNVKVMKSA